MPGPLHNITVLDLSSVIAGPYASQILGDMGATVIKIEPPQGDIMRGPGPARSAGMGAAFLNANRNKRSVTLDLKNPADSLRLLNMVADAHVFLHNMRPAAIARLGLSFEDISVYNPGLIYCAIVGYGQDGPYRNRPAYDDIIQAASGWAGLERRLGGTPKYAPTIVADKVSALYAVGAINAALLHRERTGEGQYVEVPMYETMASFLLVEHLGGRTFQPAEGESGYSRLLSTHRRPYETADGYISVMPYTREQWMRFFHVAGCADWATELGQLSSSSMANMIDELYRRVALLLVQRPTQEWMALLLDEDVPCAPVNTVDQLLVDEHMQAVGFFMAVQHPTEGKILMTRPPIRFSKTPCSVEDYAPKLEPS